MNPTTQLPRKVMPMRLPAPLPGTRIPTGVESGLPHATAPAHWPCQPGALMLFSLYAHSVPQSLISAFSL